MKTYDELEAKWREIGPGPRDGGRLDLVCVRRGGGVHECPERVELSPERGVEGDRWFEKADRDLQVQVTIMNVHVARLIGDERVPLHTPGDNLLVDLDLSEASLPPGTRLRVGGAVLEVTPEPHTGCMKFRERFGLDALRWCGDRAHRERRLRGLHALVVEGGIVAVGDPVERLVPED